jgi:hypothetical protein
VINEAFSFVPDVVYSAMDPLIVVFVTSRFDPETATFIGKVNPLTSDGLTEPPVIVYAPIKPVPKLVPKSETNKFDPDTATPLGPLAFAPNPLTSEAFTVVPAVLYAPIVPPEWFTTKIS